MWSRRVVDTRNATKQSQGRETDVPHEPTGRPAGRDSVPKGHHEPDLPRVRSGPRSLASGERRASSTEREHRWSSVNLEAFPDASVDRRASTTGRLPTARAAAHSQAPPSPAGSGRRRPRPRRSTEPPSEPLPAFRLCLLTMQGRAWWIVWNPCERRSIMANGYLAGHDAGPARSFARR